MEKFRILIFPCENRLEVYIKNKLCQRIINKIQKHKSGFGKHNLTLPTIGFKGFELNIGNTDTVYVYKNIVLHKHINIFSMYDDKRMSIYKMFMSEAMKKYNQELTYFLQVNSLEKDFHKVDTTLKSFYLNKLKKGAI